MRLTGPPAPAPRFPTLVHALRAAAAHPGGVTFVDLAERERHLPWREVHARAQAAAAALAARGVRPGDRVAIVLRTEPAFLDAFFGAWLAGAVPVPLYPPVRLGRLEEWVAGTARMLTVSGARLVVSGGGTRALLGEVLALAAPPLGLLEAGGLLEGPAGVPGQAHALLDRGAGAVAGADSAPGGSGAGAGGAPLAAPTDLGLVQFSSGSTVDPKPVALTHAALQAQADALMALVRPTSADALVSWLPLYHDMGLIGGLLAAMSYPGPLVLIAPEHFLARPALWLRALARHRATISVAPSFAYAYCAERVGDAELAGCSLASWRLALDGAEPISADAMRRFAARFAPHGFDPGALVPVYGLSEAALAVTFAAPGGAPRGAWLDADLLARQGRAVRVAAPAGQAAGPGACEVVAVGAPIPGVEVEVRGEDGGPTGEGALGRVWVRGPSLFEGYLGDPAATARALQGGWLDTGDRGFVMGGALHLHGRQKDLVIVRGANHAPEQLEAALAGLAGLRPGCAVALGFAPPGGGEALLVLAERAPGPAPLDPAALEAAIRRALLERTGLSPHTVRLLAPGTLPRTSSGKLRRQEALRRHLAGELRPPRRVDALSLGVAWARSRLAGWRGPRRGPA
ncbi:MAG: AMP-binding protein [Anaeromyxobacter sp.]|nr:AMP-binding protein [Anaeromyxobacter sp.]MBL0277077.1 AMP-binding protein [Anaeromyxobacter sp.]